MGKKQGRTAGGGGGNDASAASGAVKGAQNIKVRHILTEKRGEADAALAKLAAGTAFDTVAAAHSTDKARQGGALGWKTRGDLVGAFADAAFALPPSKTGSPIYTREPVKTSFGYHIIMVEDRK